MLDILYIYIILYTIIYRESSLHLMSSISLTMLSPHDRESSTATLDTSYPAYAKLSIEGYAQQEQYT